MCVVDVLLYILYLVLLFIYRTVIYSVYMSTCLVYSYVNMGQISWLLLAAYAAGCRGAVAGSGCWQAAAG